MTLKYARFDDNGNITQIYSSPHGFVEADESVNDTTHYVDVETRTIHPKQECAHTIALERDALMAAANIKIAEAGEAVRAAEQLAMDASTEYEHDAATAAQQAAAIAQAQAEAQLMAASKNLQVTITDLPIPCALYVQNERHDVQDGIVELSFNYPGEYSLTVESVKFLRWSGKVVL